MLTSKLDAAKPPTPPQTACFVEVYSKMYPRSDINYSTSLAVWPKPLILLTKCPSALEERPPPALLLSLHEHKHLILDTASQFAITKLRLSTPLALALGVVFFVCNLVLIDTDVAL